uniref:Uncharacterized protein n=1 Tax=Nelumbo nucifera TaxID=4432 RepID=A0A822YER5_NELNU|nr:TPA_asm: hypothetical protein HUJ06_030913 [Nelumbo nucifera]
MCNFHQEDEGRRQMFETGRRIRIGLSVDIPEEEQWSVVIPLLSTAIKVNVLSCVLISVGCYMEAMDPLGFQKNPRTEGTVGHLFNFTCIFVGFGLSIHLLYRLSAFGIGLITVPLPPRRR